MPNTLSDADYDAKLREMGNYLWDLEQEADLASSRGHQTRVDELESKIRQLGAKAESFLRIPGRHQMLAAYVGGLAHRMTRQWSNASDHFLTVLEMAPTNGEAWLELTWCLAELGKWEECEMAARKSTEIFGDTAASWGNLALALVRTGKREEARAAIGHAIRLDPKDPRNQAIRAEIESA
jgi:Flp pilus assembly protein TadD